MTPAPLFVRFVASDDGPWSVVSNRTVTGPGLPDAAAVTVIEGRDSVPDATDAAWSLSGVVSNERYVTRAERAALEARQQPLGRADATAAALIPIRKSPRWWQLTQDERRDIFEERSHHVRIGVGALPAVARRLHHSRDLCEPFDFLTWFEFAPSQVEEFDEVLAVLRASEEWTYVEREVEIRLTRS
jgi:chlorite dismutase